MIHPEIAKLFRDAQLALKGGSMEDNFGIFLLGFSYGLGKAAATACALVDLLSGKNLDEAEKDALAYFSQMEKGGGFYITDSEFSRAARKMVSAYESAVRGEGELIIEGPTAEAEAREFRRRIEAAGKAKPEARRG